MVVNEETGIVAIVVAKRTAFSSALDIILSVLFSLLSMMLEEHKICLLDTVVDVNESDTCRFSLEVRSDDCFVVVVDRRSYSSCDVTLLGTEIDLLFSRMDRFTNDNNTPFLAPPTVHADSSKVVARVPRGPPNSSGVL